MRMRTLEISVGAFVLAGVLGLVFLAVQVSGINNLNTTTSDTDLQWTNGNGSSRIVMMNFMDEDPPTLVDGTMYAADAEYGNGANLGNGWFVIYNGTGNTVSPFNIVPSTTYKVVAYEYNGAAGSELYNQSPATDNPFIADTSTIETRFFVRFLTVQNGNFTASDCWLHQ